MLAPPLPMILGVKRACVWVTRAGGMIVLGVIVGLTPAAHAGVISTGDAFPDPTTTTTADNLYIGRTADGTMTIDGGSTVSSRDGVLGYDAGVTGEATVSGSGSSWINSNQLVVGLSGNGVLNISGISKTAGPTVNSLSQVIGSASGSSGMVYVAGGALISSQDLTVGQSGSGMVHVQSGGISNTNTYLGSAPEGKGTVSLVTSTLTSSGDLYVGDAGEGHLDMHASGVTNVNAYVGKQAGATGSVFVADSTTWNNSGTLYVGDAGIGSVSMFGSHVIDAGAVIGQQATSSGSSVYLEQSVWTNNGPLTVGFFGDAELDIEDGSTVTSTVGFISVGSNSLVTVDASAWTCSDTLNVGAVGIGELDISSGGTVSNADAYVGGVGGASGIVSVNNSTWTSMPGVAPNHGDLRIANGEVHIRNNGHVTDSDARISYLDGVTATVSVNASTWTNNGNLYVGDLGHGTLDVLNGSIVTDTGGYIANGAGSTGAVTVDNSTWTNSGSLEVGLFGNGTLEIHNGGTVTSARAHRLRGRLQRRRHGGQLDMDHHQHSVCGLPRRRHPAHPERRPGQQCGHVRGRLPGHRRRHGGSRDLDQRPLYVGSGNIGTLDAFNGASIAATRSFIGNVAGSTGAATVDNSTWSNSGNFYVGYSGNGTLDIRNGGVVSNVDAHIGTNVSLGVPAVGAVTVDASTWTNSGDLYVGDAGNGTLDLLNAAIVSARWGFIGNVTGSMGAVTVDASIWTNSGASWSATAATARWISTTAEVSPTRLGTSAKKTARRAPSRWTIRPGPTATICLWASTATAPCTC